MGIPDQGHSPSLASWLTHEFDARLSPLGSDILAAKPRGVGCEFQSVPQVLCGVEVSPEPRHWCPAGMGSPGMLRGGSAAAQPLLRGFILP